MLLNCDYIWLIVKRFCGLVTMSDTPSRLPNDPCPPLRPVRYRDLLDGFPAYRTRCLMRGVPPAGRDALLDGALLHSELDGGMRIHATDAVEQHNGVIEADLPPGLTVAVVLDGELCADLDEFRLVVSGRGGPIGKLWSLTRPTRLVRHLRCGRRVRKVQVAVPHAWLRAVVDPLREAGRALVERTGEHLATADWQPSSATVRYAEEILARRPVVEALGPLEMRIRALEIVHDALGGLTATTSRAPDTRSDGASRELARARAVRAYVDTNLDRPLTLEGIGWATGMSVSTVQRVFKRLHGATVSTYLRTERLNRARAALLGGTLSIQQAAYQAGYASAANFSTAFRRQFGYSPSQCLT